MAKSVQVFITDEFNFKLKEYLIQVEKTGKKTTKAQMIVELAELGLKVERQEIKIKVK